MIGLILYRRADEHFATERVVGRCVCIAVKGPERTGRTPENRWFDTENIIDAGAQVDALADRPVGCEIEVAEGADSCIRTVAGPVHGLAVRAECRDGAAADQGIGAVGVEADGSNIAPCERDIDIPRSRPGYAQLMSPLWIRRARVAWRRADDAEETRAIVLRKAR